MSRARSDNLRSAAAPKLPANRRRTLVRGWRRLRSHRFNPAVNRRQIMDGKIIIVTGASGALGQVVVEYAIARGARVAALDHAARPQAARGPDRLEIGGVDLSDAAQATKAGDTAAPHF